MSLTVERGFNITGTGAALEPSLPMDARTPPYPSERILKRPDGMEATTRARFAQTHFNQPYSGRTIENTWRTALALPD